MIGSGTQPSGAAPLASPVDEARAFWRMRRKTTLTMAWQALTRTHLRFVLVALLSVLLWLLMFWLFVEGFAFLESAIQTRELLDGVTHAIFTHFFLALMVVLVFSSAVILYGSLFRGDDIALLFSLPARPERVFLHKLQEAIFLSSWAFLLLASPMLLAYGHVAKVPWYFYVEILPALAAFAYIPVTIGAVLCLVVVRWFPSQRLLLLVTVGAAVFATALAYGASISAQTHFEFFTPAWIQEMLGRLRGTENRWLPNWWLSTGLLSAANGQASDSVMFLVLLVSNALFLRQLAIGCSARIYRAAYSRLCTHHFASHFLRATWLDRMAESLATFLPAEMRQLVVKDFRVFRRDPLHWTQFLIFFGLLSLYFLGVRRFSYDNCHIVWVHMISFLNVYVIGLLLATFTNRFVFPMVSLEGRRLWILGLLPTRRDTILWGKFAFALGMSWPPCVVLVLLSDYMLRVGWVIAASHQVTCLVLCTGLSGIAVGLGAAMPSTHEGSPARIAAGFGGTLSLLASTLYIVVVILLTALPAHFHLVSVRSGPAEMVIEQVGLSTWLLGWLLWGTIGSLILGAAATWLPLWLGFRAFRRFEY